MQAAILATGLLGTAAVDDARSAALDDPGAWEGFSRRLEPPGGERWESYLAIEGMHCAACSLTVEETLQYLPGVECVQVNGASAIARIVWSPQRGRPSQWLSALRRAGYDGLPAGDMLSAAPRLHQQRMLLWRWLVAGFCMMQVMMYTVPVYVAAPGEMSADLAGLLRWASWLLTLPVLLFASGPFFASAWRDLRGRRVGMDVPVALGILIAFGASSGSTFDPQGPLGDAVWYDSVTMFVFFLLSGRLLEQRLRNRTAGALERADAAAARPGATRMHRRQFRDGGGAAAARGRSRPGPSRARSFPPTARCCPAKAGWTRRCSRESRSLSRAAAGSRWWRAATT
jgi:Cu2+-exporting ATPase